jgi:hypothetical protein
VPVCLRHPEPTNGVTFEIELDQDRGLVPYDPSVVAWLDGNGLRGRKLKSAAIRVLNMNLAAGQEPEPYS